MEITGSALTALFIALVWTLIKVVEHFISKRSNKSVLNSEQSLQLNQISAILKHLYEMNDVLEGLEERIKHLDELHSVYDENRVPKWYVSGEILALLRQIDDEVDSIGKDVEEKFSAIKEGQSTVMAKVLDLLMAQRLMVERLKDIVIMLNKPSE